MIVYGKITGIQPYGAFVSFDDEVKGLIHISEISERFVKDVRSFVSIDDHVLVKVIDVDTEHKQLRLSFKAVDQSMRKAKRRARFVGLPANKIGFASIKRQLPKWIKERDQHEIRSN